MSPLLRSPGRVVAPLLLVASAVLLGGCPGRPDRRDASRPDAPAPADAPDARALPAPADVDVGGGDDDSAAPPGDAPAGSPEDGAPGDGEPSWRADAGPPRAPTVLVFSRTTGYRHASIEAATAALIAAGRDAGLTVEGSEDPSLITPDTLARYGAVLLLHTTGEPFGSPGDEQVATLVAYVRGGGGLVGVHAAADAYPTSATFVSLIGGTYAGHPGNERHVRCTRTSDHPAVAAFPPVAEFDDEIYLFDRYRADNLVDLRCEALDPTQPSLPSAWHRSEGEGRVFHTTFGHPIAVWSDPRVVRDHVIAALLWVLRR